MLELQPRDRVIVLGKTGCGKGYWLKKLLADLMKRGNRIVVFDVLDEYSAEGEETPEVKLGPLTHRVLVSEFLKDPVRHLSADDLALAIVPDGNEPEDVAADFEDVAQQVKHEGRRSGRVTFAIEETGHFEEFCRNKLREVGTQYRHWGVTTILVAQRAVFVPLATRSQASHIVSFLQDEDADLDALYRRTRRTDPEFADRVGRLPLYKFEHWKDSASAEQEGRK